MTRRPSGTRSEVITALHGPRVDNDHHNLPRAFPMNTLHRARECAKLYSHVVLCSPLLLLWRVSKRRLGRLAKHGSTRDLFVLPYPSPLPTKRIDICRRRAIEQPASCRLLHLPLELRRIIFEFAVGSRLVRMEMVPNERVDALKIQTRCYRPSEVPDAPNNLLVSGEKIPIALLLVCRSVYREVLPIIHQRYTFYFDVEDFQPALQAALGQYCLKDIRSLYLYHSYPNRPLVRRWDSAFAMLQQMHVESLSLEFEILEWTEVHPHTFSLDNAWCRGLLAIRKLHNLSIFFRNGNPADCPRHREAITQTLRDLMIGPGADERYNDLLCGRGG
ncbi:hypothetical protein B0H16DRAFT_1504583 [Mycena metata]|uniref:DUF7730 domain-containing protein n=1 Tax=Mycena metata TaxID=1033252 RepID=A0AAD7NVR9_9AGAR|nr:hypothetical protein B0H16DRAFT_1504583 [Mycena metata]